VSLALLETRKPMGWQLYLSLQARQHNGGFMNNYRLLLSGLCLVILLASTQSFGQPYKWVDANGSVHYGDSPPGDANLEQITGEVSSYTAVVVEPFSYTPQGNAANAVVMYSTSRCGYCRKAARHFRKNNIPFSERDIEKSAAAAREFKQLNGRGVPIILIRDRRMNGFNAETFDRIYYANS
jgi:glutaredoxin